MITTPQIDRLNELVDLFDNYRVFYEKESDKAAATRFLQERIQKQDSVIFVAEKDGKYIGFTQLYPLFSSTRMQRLWLLNDLYVLPEYRGQHYAIALMNQAKQLAKETGACGISLETAKDNFIGNQLYPRQDFELDTQHNYYFWETD